MRATPSIPEGSLFVAHKRRPEIQVSTAGKGYCGIQNQAKCGGHTFNLAGCHHTLEDPQCDSDFPICYRASPLFLCTSHNAPGTVLGLSWDLGTRL